MTATGSLGVYITHEVSLGIYGLLAWITIVENPTGLKDEDLKNNNVVCKLVKFTQVKKCRQIKKSFSLHGMCL